MLITEAINSEKKTWNEIKDLLRLKQCNANLEVLKYSLEQYIGFVVRQAFNYYCSLHQV